MGRAVVTPDKHFPLADTAAIRCLCKAIEMVKPSIYIDLGDTGEWGEFSHWKYKRKKRPPLEMMIPKLDRDVAGVNVGMDIIDEALDKVGCKRKYHTQGNHDIWPDMFVEEHPYLSQYKFKNAVHLKERGYISYPHGKHLKIGKLYFYHGDQYGGQYHTANHLRKLGCNIMYGHHHSLQQDSVTHMDGPKSAWSLGCLKDMSGDKNQWLGGRQHKWAHAFGVIDFFARGHFTVHIVQIVNGMASLWGELIKGKKK